MSDLDLTEAIEAGASALQISVSGSVFGGSIDEVRRLFADATVRAAAPLIAAQVRAQVAAEIEARQEHDDHYGYYRSAWVVSARAARIARGES